jgi:hypothetical protein
MKKERTLLADEGRPGGQFGGLAQTVLASRRHRDLSPIHDVMFRVAKALASDGDRGHLGIPPSRSQLEHGRSIR